MNSTSSPMWNIGLRVGLITSAALLAYFFVMKLLGLHLVLELRFFNAVILAVGICAGLARLKREYPQGEYYLQGLGEGFFISVVATVPFALIISCYTLFVDAELLQQVTATYSKSLYINALTIFNGLCAEGIASGTIIGFCAMQYFKRNHEQERVPQQREDQVKISEPSSPASSTGSSAANWTNRPDQSM